MSYLHCHSCDWSQDDFYSVNGYNPASYLKDWMERLCRDDVDDQFTNCSEFLHEHGPISTREVIAREFEIFAEKIRQMKWVTYEQWVASKDTAICPNCGAKDFDID